MTKFWLHFVFSPSSRHPCTCKASDCLWHCQDSSHFKKDYGHVNIPFVHVPLHIQWGKISICESLIVQVVSLKKTRGLSDLHQVCPDCSCYFWSIMFWGCCLATKTFYCLHRFSIIWNFRDWPCHFRTLTCFLSRYSFIVWATCELKPSCPNSHHTVHGPIHPFIMQIRRPFSFAGKQPWTMMFPTPFFTFMVFFGWNPTVFFLPNMASGISTKEFHFDLIWPHGILRIVL